MSSKTFREYLYEQAFSKDVMLSKFTNNSDHIFYGNIEEDGNLSQYISDLEIDYSSLERSKLTKNEIEERLSSIFSRLSEEILKKSFRTFEEYPELEDRV